MHLSGTLRRGDGPPFEGAFAGPIVEALDAAAGDEEVRAVILRIDSPGGDALAAEEIARAVERVRAAGRPVVASLTNAGASGAYWVAVAADRIVAGADTLTGSIGVIAAKRVLGELARKLDVEILRLERGRNAGIWSLFTGFDQAERARAEALIDEVYRRFLERVAEGRKMDPVRVRELAQGRVWTGAQAWERGLVDGLGGLPEAEAAVRELLGLAPDAPLVLRRLPEPGLVTWLAALRRSLPLPGLVAGPPLPGPFLALAPLPAIRRGRLRS
ncbi:Protease 4 [bacterium HR39]|nr:Protease 4 [bacterium HR39]